MKKSSRFRTLMNNILVLVAAIAIGCSLSTDYCKIDADCKKQCQQCDNGSCIPIKSCDPCTKMSCSGNGKCTNPNGAIVCECHNGYGGERCDRCQDGFQDWDEDGECLPDCHTADLSCPNNSSCQDENGVATCMCEKGHTGDQCVLCEAGYQDNDKDGSCQTNCRTAALDCGEWGHCEDSSGSAQCECDTGYTGSKCQECAVGFEWDSINRWCAVVGMKLTAGYSHTCLLNQTGTVVCWGAGLMARNQWPDYGQSNPPDEIDDFIDIAAGNFHTCGLSADTSVKCWGYYRTDSEDPDNKIPFYSPNTVGFVALSSAYDHTCGLKNNGSIECWDVAGNSLHTPPEPNEGFVQVTTGRTHTCGLKEDNTAECWGSDDDTLQPTKSEGPYLQLSSGEEHTCAIQEAGVVKCFPSPESMEVPTSLEPFIQLDSAEYHACALNQIGEIQCWGYRNPAPKQPEENSGFIQVATGPLHRCGLKRDGSVHCWGNDQFGKTTPSTSQRKYKQIVSNGETSCALTQDGYVYCFGNTEFVANTPVNNSNFSEIDVGPFFACGIKSPGYVECWGPDEHQNLYSFDYGHNKPDFRHVTVGWTHACGLKNDDSVQCWGEKQGYAPESDSEEDCLYPDKLPKFKDLSAGADLNGGQNCGITLDGNVVCWPRKSEELGLLNSSDSFIDIVVGDVCGQACGVTEAGEVICDSDMPLPDDNEGFVQVDIDDLCTGGCGVKKDNYIVCWGHYAEIGLGFEDNDYETVHVESNYACALRLNGDISCLAKEGFRAPDLL